ncbi:aminodeoxychorismate/anthranilate synthase component II [bacterium]|nr:aminodeoxychorismate/anthranilate synthase component II [bacterium]MBU1919983.1 aminodeoxychorismate/anthranilate synthase component II [bacterium]
MIYIIDNYDSFTYNLVHSIRSQKVEVRIGLNDKITARDILELKPSGLIISPGPGRPKESGRLPSLVTDLFEQLPILGVCLGHQMIAECFGGKLTSAKQIIHGKASRIFHDGRGVFKDIPSPTEAGRYHSLAVDETSLPDCLNVTARTEDGEIMGLRHRELPIESVQFHPESILTPDGDALIKNFIDLAAVQSTAVLLNE